MGEHIEGPRRRKRRISKSEETAEYFAYVFRKKSEPKQQMVMEPIHSGEFFVRINDQIIPVKLLDHETFAKCNLRYRRYKKTPKLCTVFYCHDSLTYFIQCMGFGPKSYPVTCDLRYELAKIGSSYTVNIIFEEVDTQKIISEHSIFIGICPTDGLLSFPITIPRVPGNRVRMHWTIGKSSGFIITKVVTYTAIKRLSSSLTPLW